MRRRTSAPGRAILLALAALLIALAPAAPASAHAVLLATDPEDGAVLDTAPETVTLTFNEAVQPVGDATRLVDAAGTDQTVPATASGTAVLIDLPDLDDGAYYLNWRVISADAHPISGVLSFTVGAGTAPAAPPDTADTEPDRPWPVQTVNALFYLGLLVCCGSICFRVAIARELAPTRPRHRLVRATGTLAILTAALAVPVGALDLAGLPPGRILDPGAWTPTVQPGALLTLTATAAGLGLAYAALTRRRGRSSDVLALTGAAAAAAAPILIGHSMAFGPRWLMVAADAVHLAAAAVWAGGLAGLLVLFRNLARERVGTDDAAVVVARFSTWAGITVAALGAGGVAMAWAIHRDWDGVAASDHGRALLVKVALVALAMSLAAWNRFRLVPLIRGTGAAAALPRLRRLVRAEAAVVAGVIALTGVLVNLPPGGDEPAPTPETPAAAPAAIALRADLGGGEALLEGTVDGTGAQSLMLTLTGADGLPLEPLEVPSISATLPERDFGPLDAQVHHFGPGEYHCVIDLPLAGTWELAVQVRASAFESHTAVLDLTVQ
ncbi:copper resistance CopC/CopD family protein [Glycomyces albidus]|nr:copper resistance protein CopC [Glycomyces albidus]